MGRGGALQPPTPIRSCTSLLYSREQGIGKKRVLYQGLSIIYFNEYFLKEYPKVPYLSHPGASKCHHSVINGINPCFFILTASKSLFRRTWENFRGKPWRLYR